jgi:PAS domain S-box-containing protein
MENTYERPSGMPNLNRLKKTRLALRVVTNLAIVVGVSVLFILKERYDRASAYERERATATTALNELSQTITSKLTRILLMSSSLSGAVSLVPDIDQEAFEDFASKISLQDAGIINIATIRNLEITFVYPFAENAPLVGRSLRDMPEQLIAAERARDTGQSVLEGPIKLIQGTDGYILREPVFLNRRDRHDFWGFISIVFSGENFFADVGLREASSDYEIAIVDSRSGQSISGASALFSDDILRKTIAIPGGSWDIGLKPRSGWIGAKDSGSLVLLYLLSMAVTLTVANALFNQRQQAFRASELLQSAIDVLADGFVLFDSEDRLVVCNQKYLDLYSASAPAIVAGARFEDILRYGLERNQYQDAIGREEEWLAKRLAAHRAADGMLEQQLEDGRWLRIREMSTPDGGRVGIRVDVTQQVESRVRAEIAEGRLRDAIDAVPAGFWLFDPDEKLELVNERALEPFLRAGRALSKGDSLEDVVEAMVAIEMPHVSAKHARQRKDHFLRQLRQKSSEFETQTGTEAWHKFFGQCTNEGGLVCFGVDISELMLHERWLQQTNMKLRAAMAERDAAEARFADVADISTEWFWEQDADGLLTYLSPGFEKATGVAVATVIGQKRGHLTLSDQSDADEAIEELRQVIAAREPFNGIIYRSSIKPDTETWFRTSGKPVFAADGAFQGYLGTAANITPLYSAFREARRADEAKTQFLNVISHELRTPMTIVLGFNAFLVKFDELPELRRWRQTVETSGDTDMAQNYEAAVSTVKRFAGKIQVAGEQLQRLINDMLDLARIEANTLRVDSAPVDAGKVILSVADQMQPILEGKGVAIVTKIEHLVVQSDETRLRQILTNLVANAVKFTDKGHITLCVRRDTDMAEIEVSDTGIGIPRDALPSIFDRFTQADTSSTRNQGGAGLGLAISRELIRLQGGTVHVESELGHGTKVTFTLPLWNDDRLSAQPAGKVASK